MRYVVRDGQGNIKGSYANPNSITDQSPIDENSQEWLDHIAPKIEEIPFDISDLTKSERAKLIDFLKTSGIITTARANTFKNKET